MLSCGSANVIAGKDAVDYQCIAVACCQGIHTGLHIFIEPNCAGLFIQAAAFQRLNRSGVDDAENLALETVHPGIAAVLTNHQIVGVLQPAGGENDLGAESCSDHRQG